MIRIYFFSINQLLLLVLLGGCYGSPSSGDAGGESKVFKITINCTEQ